MLHNPGFQKKFGMNIGLKLRRDFMRLIDADKVPPLSDLSGCAYEGSEYQAYKTGAEYGRGLVDDTPTIDPESLRPTAHIMRGTVRDTYDNAFCSSCRSCLNGDEYFEDVLAHRYKYCPYCGARFVKGVSKK